ncbi:MAG: AraC family transcriptional regulator ligand-binding domain-containing protein [Pseudomonadota bacterium]|uniref:helix-turn-helix domain-containing protein n=1 Tax=Alcanivorax sp. TaxID=1872427 RepID=UPI002439D231|nr:AraC family transcriptional regulator [Alcanivorax sp.]MEE3319685.1 AraC family transcriptional regulator ligand-binding domain-containing protein [Pseudomonadota bacterium]
MVSSGRPWGNAGVPGIYVVLLYDLLVALELDAPALLAGLGVSRDELLAPDRRVSMSLAQTVAERGVAMVGERGLGFRYARAMSITLHGPVGLLALSSASAQDALEAACRFLGLRAPFLQIDQVRHGEMAYLKLRSTAQLGVAHDFVIEAMLVGLAFMVEQLLETLPEGVEIHRQGAAPPYQAVLKRDVGVAVKFDQAEDALVFPVSALAARPRLADPQVAAIAREQCEMQFRQWRTEEEGVMAERIRAALQDRPAPLPSLEAMADKLAVSARTLKRHLQQAGLSYRQLQDEERYRQAQRLLANPENSISEVAYSLGYSDVANFSKAFKRWSGLTPKGYRDQR